jgi:DNA-binding XRE family transcriptional regulator
MLASFAPECQVSVNICYLANFSTNDDKESVLNVTESHYSKDMGKPISHQHILKKFGAKLQKTRKSKDVTQEELAFRMSMDRTYIGMIERGERNPTIRTLYKIAKALKVDSTDLLPF